MLDTQRRRERSFFVSHNGKDFGIIIFSASAGVKCNVYAMQIDIKIGL